MGNMPICFLSKWDEKININPVFVWWVQRSSWDVFSRAENKHWKQREPASLDESDVKTYSSQRLQKLSNQHSGFSSVSSVQKNNIIYNI